MKKIKCRLRPILILLTALVILHTFVSCGGLPASQIDEIKEKETKGKITYVEPPEHETFKKIDPLPPYTDPTVSSGNQTTKPAATTRYAASRESDKYHSTYCYYVDNILPENLVYYSSEDAARRAGKSPCSVCNP